jgi:hypothetical protein
VIISTQSVALANCFEPDDFIVVDYEEGESFHSDFPSTDISNLVILANPQSSLLPKLCPFGNSQATLCALQPLCWMNQKLDYIQTRWSCCLKS